MYIQSSHAMHRVQLTQTHTKYNRQAERPFNVCFRKPLNINTIEIKIHYYPVRVCAAGLCVWLRRFVCGQKKAVWGFTTGKSPVSVIYCLLVEFNSQKEGLLRQAVHSGKEIWNHYINGTEKGFQKIVLW